MRLAGKRLGVLPHRGQLILVVLALLIALALLLIPADDAEGDVAVQRQVAARSSHEVLHWWVSESESEALAVLRKRYEADGQVWVDGAQAGRSAMRHALVERLAGSVPPMANLWQAGSEFPALARLDMLHNVDPVAQAQDWDRHLLPAVRARVKVGGRYFFAPTNIHGDNWLFFNEKMLRKHDIPAPRNMREAIAAMQALDRSGEQAVAIGAQQWEVGVAFTSIMLGYLSRDQYDRLYRRHDVSVFDSPEAREAFAAFDTFRRLAARHPPLRDWAGAARAVAHGKAGFQILGDYAKSEMVRAGAVVGSDIGCMITSPPQTGLLLLIDGFVFPLDRSVPDDRQHLKFAEVVMDRTVQSTFARAKGALPARIDAAPARLDSCESQLLARLDDPMATLGDPLGSLGPERVGAFNNAVYAYFSDPGVTREAALQRMAAALGDRDG